MMERPAQTYELTEVKIDDVKPNIAIVASGSYTGNNTANRAIAHGLGVVPKHVFITRSDVGFHFVKDGWVNINVSGISTRFGVSNEDITNFYVGNSANYEQSANINTHTYAWVAFA